MKMNSRSYDREFVYLICLQEMEGNNKAGKHDGYRGAQLDENVQRRTGGILERIADSIADYSGLMLI